MRINFSQDNDSLMAGPGDVYAKEIAGAGNAFSYAIYEHSKLPLRVFEAARIATAIVNGCEICKNWQSKRDIEQMGIKGGVTNNGESPDNQFYKNLLEGDLSYLNTKELIAFKFATAMGTEPKQLSKDNEFWSEIKSTFTDAEITDLTYCTAGWMGMGRVAHVLGLDGSCDI